MNERVREVLAAGFYYSGMVGLAHWWIRRSRRRLIILNYHSAVGENLRHHMLYLRRHYRLMHLEDALDEWYAPHQKKQNRDRRLPLVLTFDDGYLDNYSHGLQLARELHVPITVFLVPGYTETGHYFWWLAAEYLVQHTKVEKVAIAGRFYTLAESAERVALMQAIDVHVRHAPSVAEREQFLSDLQQAFEVVLPQRIPSEEDNGLLPLTWAEIREMEQSGWVSFGAHTMHHPVLAYLADSNELAQEVTACRQELERQLEHPVRTFAYPIGKFEHFGDRGLQAVKEAGYTWALTTIEETNTMQTDPYLLCRLPGDVEQHWLVMAAELTGLLGILSRCRKKR